MRKIFLIALFLGHVFAGSHAQVYNVYDGNIDSDTYWQAPIIYIHTDVNVKENVTLTIGEGSEVIFKGHHEIKVRGNLEALGTGNNKIIFKPENTATGWEGFIIQPKANNTDIVKLYHCVFEYGNAEKGDGGGVLNIEKDATIDIQDCIFRNNTAKKNGGAINATKSTLTISRSTFQDNFSPEHAGAIYLVDEVDFQITNSIFQNNKAVLKGGAIYSENTGKGEIIGSLITNNEAQEGGGLYFNNNPELDIVNATIAYNKASVNNTDGIQSISTGIEIINSIIWNNPYAGISTASVNYSIMWQMSSAANKIYNVDPEFISPTTATGNTPDAPQANWSVEYSSKAYNGGNPNAAGLSLPTTDISGNIRLVEDTIDMGAFEKAEIQPFNLVAVTDTIICVNEPLVLVSPVKGSIQIWKKDGNTLPVNNDTLIIPATSASDEGVYTYILKEGTVEITSKPLQVVVNPSPASFTLDDITICEGDVALIDPSLDPGLNFQWNTGESAPSINISQEGMYWLSATNEHDCAASDTFLLTTKTAPMVNLPEDAILCTSESAVTISSNATNYTSINWETTGGGSIETFNADADITYTFSAEELQNAEAITFYATANNDYCDPAKDTVTISLESVPELSISDEKICQGESTVFTAPENQEYVYEWSTGESTHEITASQPGVYWVKITTSASCVITDTFNLAMEAKPTVFLPDDYILCKSENALNLSSNATNYTSINWETTGAGNIETFNADADIAYTLSAEELEKAQAVTFYVSATNNVCSPANDSITVFLDEAPDFNLPDTVLCEGGIIQIQAKTTNGYTYLWSNGATEPAITLSEEGTYWLEITNTNNCSYTDTFSVQKTFPPSLSLEDNFVICSSDSMINIIPVVAENYTTISWISSGEGFMDILNNGDELVYAFSKNELLNTNPLTLIATAVSTVCPETKDTLVIERQAAPFISAPLDLNVCFTQQAIEMNVGVTEGYELLFQASEDGEISYVDSVLSFIPGITDTGLDAISLLINTQEDPVCPSVTHEITLNNAKPRAAFTVPDGCTDEEMNFLNTVYPIPGNKVFQWDFGDGNTSTSLNPSHTYADSGKYEVQLIACGTDACCDTTSHAIEVTLKPEPSFEASYNCENISLTYTGTQYKDFKYRWRLSNGFASEVINPVFENNTSQNVTLSVTHGRCTAVLEESIDPFMLPEAQFTSNVRNAGVNQQVSFINQSKNATSYEWTFEEGKKSNAANPTHTFTSTGLKTVYLKAHSEDNCVDEYESMLDISAGLASPTAFSPNRDNINDEFKIMGGPFDEYELMVFNKWGIQLFYSRNPDEGWDGTFNGQPQPVGDYVYKVIATSVSGGKFAKSGSFTLIR